ncbi:MAG: RNA-binding transcriptional accessory protein [Candidatus Omnitrophica bacterium]|nr:RNA-binding transcriptional accessory protein [Candidatus Omnitrophota bacterium]MDE2008867.1 RNA-binding transcriptional accessory protein [Candidatus Omnitrophota bacterium]MDE2213570.1 RNA-binding transcriptional accessory protein [Candidatus Omnitrophota bacterium]MDE2230529.1 RNA-binding transcriptional accessory protein [Candidatus Omnitrophota bacterium]
MDFQYVTKVAAELKLREFPVATTAKLLAEGSTVPFIARYRKEATGGLDEVAITAIRDRLLQLQQLDERRRAVLESIEKQGKLNQELKEKIDQAESMAVLEDLYLPYKPKRRTRATMAREKGLEPLAQLIFDQSSGLDPRAEGAKFINEELKVASMDEALAGARDIIAEWVNENSGARAAIRQLYLEKGIFDSKVIKGKEQEGIKFKDYYDWQEAVKTAPSHRVLAMRRGEKEEFLMLRVIVPQLEALTILRDIFLKNDKSNLCAPQMEMALEDSFKRLLSLSMETEIRLLTKEIADGEAIKVFADNLRQLLMASPLGAKNVLAIDPGLRTGCKVVCLDAQGKLLHHTAIFISQSDAERQDAAKTVRELCRQHHIECIAVGNGTAGRETESFVRSLLKEGKSPLPSHIQVILVNESGASIYSASEVAREEFADYDVTVRGSVSIGRRLQDPLAELVKIDPKSIGVGQYQHDVDQSKLKKSLDDVVVSCVNQVGVEVNSASKQLLMYVSGLGPALAGAIVEYRNAHGAFDSREELRKVPKLGDKAFEQAAGFLRIRGARNPLDASGVHPESYGVVESMARDLGVNVPDLMKNMELQKKMDVRKYVTVSVGLPTLLDIKDELAKPGRDPRAVFEPVQFKEGVAKIEDLLPGMELNGVVTNITNFGAFVDVGVHQDGLVHISAISETFVKNPADVLKVGQKVKVWVIEVDSARKRISLSMRKGLTGRDKSKVSVKPKEPPSPPRKELYRW